MENDVVGKNQEPLTEVRQGKHTGEETKHDNAMPKTLNIE